MITSLDEIIKLSSFWTIRKIVSEVQILTNITNVDHVWISNIRTHLNSNLSYLWGKLNAANLPWYEICLIGSLESTLHPSGLHYIKLFNDTLADVNGLLFNPATMIDKINEVSMVSNGNANDWAGHVASRNKSDLAHLSNEQNDQWYQSIAYNHYGSYVLFLVGKHIATTAVPRAQSHWDISSQNIALWVTRRPILDNLLPYTDANSNIDSFIDLADPYVDLLIKLTVLKVLQQMEKQVPAEIENGVNAGIESINQMIMFEMQHERAIKERMAIGKPQQFGGGYQNG